MISVRLWWNFCIPASYLSRKSKPECKRKKWKSLSGKNKSPRWKNNPHVPKKFSCHPEKVKRPRPLFFDQTHSACSRSFFFFFSFSPFHSLWRISRKLFQRRRTDFILAVCSCIVFELKVWIPTWNTINARSKGFTRLFYQQKI